MSTRIGTMHPPREVVSWLPALLTLLVVVTFAAVIVSVDRDRVSEPAGTGTAESTLANTPTELRGGLPVTAVGGTLANTPIEMSGGIQGAAASDEGNTNVTGRRGVTPRVGALDTVANTPSELNGGFVGQEEPTWTPANSAAERYSRHQMV